MSGRVLHPHTPKPWHVCREDVHDVHGLVIARVWGVEPTRDADEVRANMNLIATAPELADLVLRTYAHVSHGGPTRAEAEIVLKKAGLL